MKHSSLKTSNLSENFLETLLKIYKVEGFLKQYKFHPTRRWRFDFANPLNKIAVEVDGGQWVKNGGRHNRDSDREKINTATSMGWRVLRFSTQELHKNPQNCIEKLKLILDFGKHNAL